MGRRGPTTTSLSSSAVSTDYGQAITFTTVVSAGILGSEVPTGIVTFLDNGMVIGTGMPDANGQASFTTWTLPTGNNVVTACYGGDTNSAPSQSGSVSVTVSQAASTTVVTASANPSVYGQQVTFTATVALSSSVPNGPDTPAPTGTVTFMDGGTPVDTETLDASGQATFTTSTLSVGSHTISVSYGGDANFYGSVSNNLPYTVNQAATATVVTATANPSVYGQQATFTATVSAVAPSLATPTGTVAFVIDGNTYYGCPMNGGTSTFALATLWAGTHQISAFYTTDNPGTFLNSHTTVPFSQVVSPAPLVITADDATMVYGGALPVLTASFSGFVNGDTPASLNTQPTLTLSPTVTPTSPVGSYASAITASGAVDPNYDFTYVAGTLTIAPAGVSGVTPNAGPTAGGTVVTISGENLSSVTAVYFGGTLAAGFSLNAEGQIVAASPAGSACTVDVTVQTPLGNSLATPADQFRYVLAPIVTSTAVLSGGLFGTTVVDIYGSNLSDPTTAVFFDATPATGITIISDNEIIADCPAGADPADATVVNAGGSSAELVGSPLGALSPTVSAAPATIVTRSVSEESIVTRSVSEGIPAATPSVLITLRRDVVGPAASATPDVLIPSRRSVMSTMSPAAADAVFASPDSQSAGPRAWLAAIESFWSSPDQNQKTRPTVEAVDKVLAEYGI